MKNSHVPWEGSNPPRQKETDMQITDGYHLTLAKGRTLDEIVRASEYSRVNQLVREALRRGRLPVQEEKTRTRKIGLMEVDRTVASNEVLAKANEAGYARPTIEDVFLFGEQHSDEVRLGGKIVFLHDPPYPWNGHLFSLVLGFERTEGLVITFISATDWHDGYRFALRKR